MKIIDLLNKIANGKIPKKIVYDEMYFTYDDERKNYYAYDDSEIDWKYTVMEYINDEIEIIEEEKKIPEKLTDILKVDDLIPPVDENMYKIWEQTIKNQNKINEICDYLKSKGE